MNRKCTTLFAVSLFAAIAAAPAISFAASASSSAEITQLGFTLGRGSFIDQASVQKEVALTFSYDGTDTVLYDVTGTGLGNLHRTADLAMIDASTSFKGRALASTLDVSNWESALDIPSTGDGPVARASTNVYGDVHVAPHSSVSLDIDWKASNASRYAETDKLWSTAASGLSANFSSADAFFVPTALSYYYESAPGAVDSFASSHKVVYTNKLDTWAVATFSIASVSEVRAVIAAPIPEPSEWAMLVCGLAFIGGTAHLKKRRDR